MARLKYVSESILADLKANVPANLEKYRGPGFDDCAQLNGWSMELSSVEVDVAKLDELDPAGGSDAETRNSMIVFQALEGMTPALATEERVWTRLTHFECLEYTRRRWPLTAVPKEKSGFLVNLTGPIDESEAQRKKVYHQNISQVERHFFARGRTGCRDDNAVSRLWWNAYIAWRVDSEDQESVLQELLRTADIRSNLVERPMLSNRAGLLRGIIRAMRKHPDVYESERAFRNFMVSINFRCGGILFEALSDQDIDAILLECRESALRKILVLKQPV